MDVNLDPTQTLTNEEVIAGAPAPTQIPKWNGKGRPPTALVKDLRSKKVAFFKTEKKKKDAIAVVNKLDLFMEAFLSNGGNATEAAWKVYNCKNRAVAAQIGHEQLQRAKEMGKVYLEANGAAYGDLLKTAVAKMKESDTPEWWDRLMKLAGYEDFITKQKPIMGMPSTVINVIGQAQKKLASEYIEGEEITDDSQS